MDRKIIIGKALDAANSLAQVMPKTAEQVRLLASNGRILSQEALARMANSANGLRMVIQQILGLAGQSHRHTQEILREHLNSLSARISAATSQEAREKILLETEATLDRLMQESREFRDFMWKMARFSGAAFLALGGGVIFVANKGRIRIRFR